MQILIGLSRKQTEIVQKMFLAAKYFLKNYRGASWKGGRLEIFYLIDFEGAKRLKQEAIIHNFY